nr:lymphocyte specific protein tyrosine kinase [Hymenolepis microstoma]
MGFNLFCCKRPTPTVTVNSPDPQPIKVEPQLNFVDSNLPQFEKRTYITVCALYDYTPLQANELEFNRDDILKIIDLADQPWQMAVNTRTGQKGLIPHNYVTESTEIAGALSAWYPANRVESEKRLLAPGTELGSFMIRPSRKESTYALSVRTKVDGYVKIRHFQIYRTSEGFYIDRSFVFTYMNDLIDFYREYPIIDDCTLTTPCEREKPQAPFKEAELNRSMIKMIKLIDTGNFGEVWLGRIQSVEVAIKKPLHVGCREDFLKEAKKMHAIWHRQLVQFLGVCVQPETEPILIITEYMRKGSLAKYLKSQEGLKLEKLELLLILDQVASGMCYLESINFVHRDLRAANVFVAENLQIKVGDFGQSKMLSMPSHTPLDVKTPVRWSSPEALTDESRVNSKSDVWQFGILSYEVFTHGAMPYDHYQDKKDACSAILRGEILSRPAKCPQSYYIVVQACWKFEQDSRPTFREVKNRLEGLIESIDKRYVPDWANDSY